MGHEDNLNRDDTVRNEIIINVFGESNMGFQPEEESDIDPFSSNSDDSNCSNLEVEGLYDSSASMNLDSIFCF